MTDAYIIKLAMDANLFDDDQEPLVEHLEQFAALVTQAERTSRQAAQAENEQLKARLARSGVELRGAVLAERDECAKACHDVQMGTYLHQSSDYYDGENEGAKKCWQRIRARNHIVELNKKPPGLALDSGEFVPADCVGCDCADNEPCRKTVGSDQ